MCFWQQLYLHSAYVLGHQVLIMSSKSRRKHFSCYFVGIFEGEVSVGDGVWVVHCSVAVKAFTKVTF